MLITKVFITALSLNVYITVSLTEARYFKHNHLRRNVATENCPTPPTPPNAEVVCDYTDTLQIQIYCFFTCKTGYRFEGVHFADLAYSCDTSSGFLDTPNPPPCIRKCDPPCLNGGVCTAPNVCTCKLPYYGDRCLQNVTKQRRYLNSLSKTYVRGDVVIRLKFKYNV